MSFREKPPCLAICSSIRVGCGLVTTTTVPETRRAYSALEKLQADLRGRTGRSILHALDDAGDANIAALQARGTFHDAVLIGFVALATDTGLIWMNRRSLQNAVDAAALAGVALATTVLTIVSWCCLFLTKATLTDVEADGQVHSGHLPSRRRDAPVSGSNTWARRPSR